MFFTASFNLAFDEALSSAIVLYGIATFISYCKLLVSNMSFKGALQICEHLNLHCKEKCFTMMLLNCFS